jgi:hypothetical protein
MLALVRPPGFPLQVPEQRIPDPVREVLPIERIALPIAEPRSLRVQPVYISIAEYSLGKKIN